MTEQNASDAGYEAGIMRCWCVHSYAPHSMNARAFLLAFKRGQAMRAILDQRGLKRVQVKIERAKVWTWIVKIEGEIVGHGTAATYKEACIDTDVCAVEAIEKMEHAV